MRSLGLGLGISCGNGAGGVSLLDPATQSLSLYLKNFAGVPWTSTASAGTSGGRTFDVGGSTAVGTGASADFDGLNSYLDIQGGLKWNALTTRAAYFMQLVFMADVADATNVTKYAETPLIGDNGGNIYLNYTSSGLRFGHYDDVDYRATAYVAAATAAKHRVQAWYDGTNLNLRVNGGTAVTAAAANFTSAYNLIVPRLGHNFTGGTAYFNGRIWEVIVMPSVPDATTRDRFDAAALATYGT